MTRKQALVALMIVPPATLVALAGLFYGAAVLGDWIRGVCS